MSTLDSLIRVHRWKLDEQRRQVAELERLAQRLREEGERLDQELSSEQRVAASSYEASLGYPSFARELIERRRKLAASAAEVDGRIAAAREALAEAFTEVKRYEIAAANRAKRERAVSARKQAIAQDEVALQIFRRRGAGG